MDEWLDELADALGVARVEPEEMGAVLKLAREVAHGVERKLAPLSTFVAGVYAAGAASSGVSRAEALRRAVEEAYRLIPENPDGSSPKTGSNRASF